MFFEDNITANTLLMVWLVAGWLVGRLAYAPTGGSLRRRARWARGLVVAGVVVFGLKLVLELLLGVTVGWWYAGHNLAVVLPVLVLPVAASAVWTVPRLGRVRRCAVDSAAPAGVGTGGVTAVAAAGGAGAVADRDGVAVAVAERPGADAVLAAAAEPAVVLPVQAAALASAIAVWFEFNLPAPPYYVPLLKSLIVLAGGTVLLGLAQGGRHRRLAAAAGATPPPGRWVRGRRSLVVTAATLAALAGFAAYGFAATGLPDDYGVTSSPMEFGGGPAVHHVDRPISVDDLKDTATGGTVDKFTLTAGATTLQLASGKSVSAWTFNGQSPGPALVVHQGDTVEVTLVNNLPGAPVTLHWHGVNVPDSQDGVPGVTQNAVAPGQSYTYRFQMKQTGTYWYHSHEQSSVQVAKGLYGALISLPAGANAGPADVSMLYHSWTTEAGDDVPAFGLDDDVHRQTVATGTQVRVRLTNTDVKPQTFQLNGAPFTLSDVDGKDVHEPGTLTDARVKLAAGGRYDLVFTMGGKPVFVGRPVAGKDPALGTLFSPDGGGTMPATPSGPVLDLAAYGTPAPTPFNRDSTFNRSYTIYLDHGFGFYDGKFGSVWRMDGRTYPDTPMMMVAQGDLVRITFYNRSFADHPMHLHGHDILVLARDGKPTTGSPWWTDTVDVPPGTSFTIGFRADNPGIWMEHCHNLKHANGGMMLHIGYIGVTTPYTSGGVNDNSPE
jgi:FtsP/CotA-like multicopper oxidase with cupredoxin domain